MSEREHFIVQVTFTEEYIFPVGVRETPEEVVQEFFTNFNPNSYHATRDGSRIGGSKKIWKAEITKTGIMF